LRTILLSALSHDLRTPLTSITGAVTSLRERRASAEDHKDLLLSIEEGPKPVALHRQYARHVAHRVERAGAADLVDVAEVIRRPRKSQRTFQAKYFDQHRARPSACRGDANLLDGFSSI
jgi:two-component system sensor histidine kinase KdpD